MDGLKSKNAKQRAEILEHLGHMVKVRERQYTEYVLCEATVIFVIKAKNNSWHIRIPNFVISYRLTD